MTAALNVVESLDPFQEERETSIKWLKEMLEEAEKGDVIEIAAVVTHRNGGTTTRLSKTKDSQRRIGALALLFHRALENADAAST